MKEANLHDPRAPRCDAHGAGAKQPAMLQMRFVAACANGHLRDFPWLEWLAAGEEGRGVDSLRRDLTEGARLRQVATGESGGAGVRIELVRRRDGDAAWSILAKRTLAGAFGGDPASSEPDATPLSRIGVKCCSENPAIAISPGDSECNSCDAPLLVLLRGAGNLYFADVASAIHIPDKVPGKLSDELVELLEDDAFVRRLLREASRANDGRLDSESADEAFRDLKPWITLSGDERASFVTTFNAIEPFRQLERSFSKLKGINDSVGLDEQTLLSILASITLDGRPLAGWRVLPTGLLERALDLVSGACVNSEAEPADDQRSREFKVFSQSQGEVKGMPKSILKIRSHPIASYGGIISSHFEHISLLDTLRETRVLKGYSRLYARSRQPHEYTKLLWRSAPAAEGTRWLPATMVYGEGIFLRFRQEALELWERGHLEHHVRRLDAVTRSMAQLARRRGIEPESSHPRRAMIHTFAHLLINQLIFDSGYGSSSLRERIYFSERSEGNSGMAGILIYTAAGDSEGSMGGLVRMGEPGRLEGAVGRALENAKWCSSDPVCIESEGQGPDSCNLAACHSCGLLPETSCENQNRLLDRGTVVGTLGDPDCGYFSKAFEA
ncbi:DUF1998 domain-containing protein [Luteimonas pelagia]